MGEYFHFIENRCGPRYILELDRLYIGEYAALSSFKGVNWERSTVCMCFPASGEACGLDFFFFKCGIRLM